MTTSLQQIQPLYGSTFHCIGSACEDSCCNGMGVLVDKATYESYQGLPEGTIQSLVAQFVTINTPAVSDSLYATINLTPSGNCPFFTSERLCGMQKEFGHEYLSATCSIYPRVLNKVEGGLETSLYLSCPEAARFILLTPNSTSVPVNVASSPFRTDQFSLLALNEPNAIYKPYAYFDQVRFLIVKMIRDRTRPLWQRLFLLGMFCHDLTQITSSELEPNVLRVLAEYEQIIATGAFHGEMEGVPAHPAAQLEIVLYLTDQRIRAGNPGERFLQCFQDFLQGIGHSPACPFQSQASHYQRAEEQFCQPFLEQHPHIMENYLLNYVFRTLFPFGRRASAHFTPQSILGEYTLMATQYALVHGLLIGMAGHYQDDFSAEHIVKLFQSFSRAVEHSPTFLTQISEFARNQSLETPQGFATLLKCSSVESRHIVAERRVSHRITRKPPVVPLEQPVTPVSLPLHRS